MLLTVLVFSLPLSIAAVASVVGFVALHEMFCGESSAGVKRAESQELSRSNQPQPIYRQLQQVAFRADSASAAT